MSQQKTNKINFYYCNHINSYHISYFFTVYCAKIRCTWLHYSYFLSA